MELEALETFLKVAELGSFAAVARVRQVAPSTVSRELSELEEALGLRLFQRTTRRLSLTEAGEVYREQITPLLRDLGHARDQARELTQTPRGLLRVAVASSFAQVHLSAWLVPLLQRYPKLDIELVLDAAYTDLVRERIDVAVRLGQPASSSAIVRRLSAMPRALVASPACLKRYPVKRPEQLSERPCLVFPYGGEVRSWKFRDGKAVVTRVRPCPRLKVPEGTLLRDMAVAGVGFALLPRWLCAEALRSGELVDVFPKHDVTPTDFDSTISLVFSTRSQMPLKLRVFVDHLSELFRHGPPWDRGA